MLRCWSSQITMCDIGALKGWLKTDVWYPGYKKMTKIWPWWCCQFLKSDVAMVHPPFGGPIVIHVAIVTFNKPTLIHLRHSQNKQQPWWISTLRMRHWRKIVASSDQWNLYTSSNCRWIHRNLTQVINKTRRPEAFDAQLNLKGLERWTWKVTWSRSSKYGLI